MQGLTKELLSEVLGKEIIKVSKANETLLNIIPSDFKTEIINIHELAHKCKEWAFGKGYYLSSTVDTATGCMCEITHIAIFPTKI